MNKVYVLVFEMYNEWARENGACDFIGVYKDIDTLYRELDSLILCDKENKFFIDDQRELGFIEVYCCEENYENGIEDGAYRIFESEVE